MSQQNLFYDVIVVGAGHAGVEAALASARTGAQTLLITQNLETLGQMSCNPAIGGIGKGHLVREIDALGGAMAHAIDRAGIQFRILNQSKGPAVRATRAQADRVLYKQAIREIVEAEKNLCLFQAAIIDLIVHHDRVQGVITQAGLSIQARSVVLTVGTFLGGIIHMGTEKISGGRAGDPASIPLAQRLRSYPFRVGRLKTGTPPRLDARSIDFSRLIPQPGDTPCPYFSVWHDLKQDGHIHPEQVACYIAQTNIRTHDIIRANLHLSPMYSGQIESVGPRYCPSIEDKIVRFSDRDAHQIFIEPEGLKTYEVYPNGISTSLPYSVQVQLVQSMEGFEHARIMRPGYAIEYDYFEPQQLLPSLETKVLSGLFFAGQINGTTGYEEAAAQGLIAGLNAARQAQGLSAWYPKRHEAYIGVLIDDLITLGTQEPYRMFTSRAEYRLRLREDNADLRLTEQGRILGLIPDVLWQKFLHKKQQISAAEIELKNFKICAGSDLALRLGLTDLSQNMNVLELLKRSEFSIEKLLKQPDIHFNYSDNVLSQIEINIKYAGYIQRQDVEITQALAYEQCGIPIDLDYSRVIGLSREVVEKLTRIKPVTLAQASRISGVTPAAVSLLLVFLKRTGLLDKKLKDSSDLVQEQVLNTVPELENNTIQNITHAKHSDDVIEKCF